MRRRISSTATRSGERVDVGGIALLALGIGCLQMMLDRGNDLDWFGSPTIAALGAVALVALACFVAWELTESHPVVDLTLFARRNFSAGTAALCLGYFAFFGNLVLLPLWLQNQMGYTATWAGLAAAPVGVLPFLLAAPVARLMGRIDLRWIISASFALLGAVALWFTTFDTEVTFPMIAWARFAQGAGVALFFAPIMSLVFSGQPPGRIAAGAGLANTLRTLAGSFATSLTVTWWDRREALHQTRLVESISAFNTPTNDPHALALIDGSLIQQAWMAATIDLFWLWGWGLFALVAVVWMARPPFAARSVPSE